MGNTQARLEDPDPFKLEDTTDLPPQVIQVWNEVAKHVKNESQAPLERSKSALEFVKECLGTHKQAQQFVEQCMSDIVKEILSRESPKEENDESQCIEECLKLSTEILVKNIDLQLKESGTLETTAAILMNLFCKENKYYLENEGKMIRYKVIDTFHVQGGFSSLVEYISSPQFSTSPSAIEFLECVVRTGYKLAVAKEKSGVSEHVEIPDHSIPILCKLPLSLSDFDHSPQTSSNSSSTDTSSNECIESTPDFSASRSNRKKDVVCLINCAVGFIRNVSLPQLRAESLPTFERLLDNIGSILIGTKSMQSTQEDTERYVNVIQDLVLQMLSSNRAELKDFGWNRILSLVLIAQYYRPPPQTVIVSNAAHGFVNGTFTFLKQTTDGLITVFDKRVPEGVGRDVYLFSVRRRRGDDYLWVIASSRHETVDKHYITESPSKIEPPMDGWRHIGPDGKGILPTLRCVGFAPGQESTTLEHRLVKWAHDNRIINRLCNESSNSNFREWSVHANFLIKLMSFMDKRCDEDNHSSQHRLALSHLLPAWDLAIKSDDRDESSKLLTVLALALPHLPDDIAQSLLRKVRHCLQSHQQMLCFRFFNDLVSLWDGSSGVLKMPFMSDVLRTETKKLMWILRSFVGHADVTYDEIHTDWFEWEATNLHNACTTKDVAIPQKPKVSILDPKSRLVEVSLPIESVSGEYYVGAFVRASCDNYENGETMLLAIIATSDIEECLNDDEDRVNVQLCLPEDGLWSIEWCGVLRRDEPLATPRSALTLVDLTIRDKELMRRYREKVGAMDELARKQAGDIQSTVRKLRGSGSSKMTIESRYSLLNTALVSGRSTLNKLRRLVATYECECEEASVSGIVSLENALAEAQLPMAELEASLKSRNKKERIKGFKTHMTTLLQNGEVTSWLESVQQNDLDSLGGDSNRLYQLLVEAKGSQLNAAAIETASTRADLFSKKQIKTLATLWEEIRRVHTSHAGEANEAPSESFATEEQVPLKNQNAMQSPIATTVALSTVTPYSCSKESLRIGASHPSTESLLLAFLKENADCLKGSPDAFHHWLADSEDIASLNDLADAVADDQYLQDVLHRNGLKGFKRSVFQKAILVATGRCHNVERQQNKENEQPLSKLMCPLSGVLMTDRPVIAADGYTYELAAIAEWFENQNQEVEAAKKLIAAGNKSKELLSIVDGGIVSPVTRTKMDSLALAPNKTVQTMARDVAKAKKRVPFGRSLK